MPHACEHASVYGLTLTKERVSSQFDSVLRTTGFQKKTTFHWAQGSAVSIQVVCIVVIAVLLLKASVLRTTGCAF